MATVPFIFSNQSGPIPLSQLDANFANVKANVVAAETAVVVTANSQPAITSLGTLSGLTVNGNLHNTGNITNDNIVQTAYLTVTNNAVVSGNLTVLGTTTTANATSTTTTELTLALANNQSSGTLLNGAGILVGLGNVVTWRYNNSTTSWQSNVNITPASNVALNLGGVSNYWGTVYANTLTLADSASIAGNITASADVAVNGNVSAGNISVTQISASGTVVGGTVRSTGSVSAVGNVIGGGILSSTSVSAVGNITGGNLIATTNISGTNVSVSGTVSAGNIVAVTTLSSIGNVVALNVNATVNVSAGGNVIGSNVNGIAINGTTITGTTISATNLNATNITFGSPLTPASGGTGLSSLTANAVLVGNGTSSVQSVAPGTSGYALRSTGTNWTSGQLGLGMSGETWNNLTSGSRVPNTVYTNSRSYPIMVSITMNNEVAWDATATLFVGSVAVAFGGTPNTGDVNLLTTIVPPGQTYRYNRTALQIGALGGYLNWAELY